jgi:hypothetical protein
VEARVATSSKTFLTITLLAVSCCVGSAKSEVQPEVRAAPSQPLVVQNYYYALPGKAADVYLWRLHASDVRAKLGLARGRVLDKSEEFDEVQKHMDTLIRDFRRVMFQVSK